MFCSRHEVKDDTNIDIMNLIFLNLEFRKFTMYIICFPNDYLEYKLPKQDIDTNH